MTTIQTFISSKHYFSFTNSVKLSEMFLVNILFLLFMSTHRETC